MTWEEELFAVLDDLEGEASGAFAREREAELADRRRAEYAEVTLAARLMASTGTEVVLDVRGAGTVAGRVERVGTGWLHLRGAGTDWVVRDEAVTGVRGASARAVPALAWPVGARLRLGSALRRLADAEERCVFHAVDGTRHEGVVRRVGADFAEVAAGEPERLALVPFATLAAVQSRD